MARIQKNMRLDAYLVEVFGEDCNDSLLDQPAVIEALMAFWVSADAEERARIIERFRLWKERNSESV